MIQDKISEKDGLVALIIAIILRIGERIGNEESATYQKTSKEDKRKKAYGVSVFKKSHVDIIGNKIHFNYIGKKGVLQDKSFSDEKIAKALKIAIKKSPSKFIFTTSEGQKIGANHVNEYLKSFNITAKGIRGWYCNRGVLDKLKDTVPEDSERKRRKQLNIILKNVAAKVGHGPSVLKNQYLMPEVITSWIDKGEVFDIKEAGYVMKEGGKVKNKEALDFPSAPSSLSIKKSPSDRAVLETNGDINDFHTQAKDNNNADIRYEKDGDIKFWTDKIGNKWWVVAQAQGYPASDDFEKTGIQNEHTEFYKEILGDTWNEKFDNKEDADMIADYLSGKMSKGGIPNRYKEMGFTRVGQKKRSIRPEKKWMVLAKKGDKYRVVHGGQKGMEDFSQHHDKERQKRFWSRMGGFDSEKAKDPFSPLYWHKRFGTWEEGGALLDKGGSVESREFKKWFGDSKTVDDKKKPLKLYHGTDSDTFTVFDRSKTSANVSSFGFFFTDDKEFAKMFGENIMEVYVSIQNPLVISQDRWNEARIGHAKDGGYFSAWRSKLINQGYDGVRVEESFEEFAGRRMRNPQIFIAFYPEQIKLSNNKTFDPKNPDIRYENGGDLTNNDDFANSEKSPIFTLTKITKEDVDQTIKGTRSVTNGAAIQAAVSYLRRSKRAGSLGRSAHFFKGQDEEGLREYISTNNLWLPLPNPKDEFAKGGEATVYLYGDYVIKINDSFFYGSWEDYLNSLLLHNLFFPLTSYELIGFSEYKDFDERTLYAVVKQAFINMPLPRIVTDLDRVRKFMSDLGFTSLNKTNYYHTELGITVKDLHEGNVLTKYSDLIKDNVLYFIDTVLYLDDKENKENGGEIESIKGNLSFKKMSDNLFVVTSDTQEKLAKLFVRPNSYLDCRQFKGKTFTLKEFSDWYAKEKGGFTYYQDYKGFNIPDSVIDVFLSGDFDPLSEEEKWLIENLKSAAPAKPYYVIGYVHVHGEEETRHHELAHALYYLSPTYKNEVDDVIEKFWKEISPKAFNNIQAFLTNLQYDRSIWSDEMNAYLVADKDYLVEKNAWSDEFDKYRRTLSKIFEINYLKTFGKEFENGLDQRHEKGGSIPSAAQKQIDEYIKEGVFMSEDDSPVVGLLPISRFNGPKADIFPNQLAVEVGGVKKWTKRIQAGERPYVLIDYSDWAKENRVKDAHHRLKAYEELGFSEIPVIDRNGRILNQERMAAGGMPDADYKKWKRQNVTLRGMKEVGQENSAGAMLGKGLYTAALSNKALSKEYGTVYFAVNAKPRNPKKFNTLNDWEIWFYNNLVYNYSKAKGKDYPDKRDFNANATIEGEMQKLGYDGIEITGREMVNFTPSEDVMYFRTEDELRDYYDHRISNMEAGGKASKNHIYIYHGTGKGQALNMQRDGFMKPNKTGEEHPSISFTNSLDYAEYYAKSKGGSDRMVILRTKLDDSFKLSPRIRNNKGDEYVTFRNIPSSHLELMASDGSWKPLDKWNVVFDEPLKGKMNGGEVENKKKKIIFYHGVKNKEDAEKILKEGFKLSYIKPLWQNDYAISVVKNPNAVRKFFGRKDVPIIKIEFEGNIVPPSEVGWIMASSAQDYTRQVVEDGIDAVSLEGGFGQSFIYNTKAIKKISLLEPGAKKYDGGNIY